MGILISNSELNVFLLLSLLSEHTCTGILLLVGVAHFQQLPNLITFWINN